MIAWVVLALINIMIFFLVKEDERFTEVKKRYKILINHLKSNDIETFRELYTEIPIVAHHNMSRGIGYNIEKGGEIGLCIDGDVNDIFHVLLHELAHCTVDEYSHSEQFWDNFKKLKNEEIHIGLYKNISHRKAFCGKHVMDK